MRGENVQNRQLQTWLIWFARDISFEVGETRVRDIVSLPRLVKPRSNEKLSDDRRITSTQSVKLAVVERAIHNISSYGLSTFFVLQCAPNDCEYFCIALKDRN